MPDKYFKEAEEARKRKLAEMAHKDYIEAKGSELESKEDEDLEKQNDEIRKQLAEGAKFPEPKPERSITMGQVKKASPKQEKAFKAIKDEFKWDRLRKHLFGE